MAGQMLSGKVAVITGAGRGLGKASAKVCLREGAKVLAVDFSGDEEKTAAELGPCVLPFHADVSKEDQVEAAFAAALKAFGRVDASLHSAATLGGKPKGEVTLEEYERMTNTNFLGILLCC